MTWRSRTAIIIVCIIAFTIIWDCIAMWMGGVEATESRIIYELALHNPTIPFGAGYLCGHFFGSQQLATAKPSLPGRDTHDTPPVLPQ